jgi:hypothetical protein
MLVGEHWTVAAACEYVLGGRQPAPRKLERAGIRRTTAGRLRAAGIAVVHTPGISKEGPHVSIVWPDDAPLDRQDVPWPSEISSLLGACLMKVR